jgi:RNA polymerase sigma-70 factor (ECF subfamily)
MAHAPPRINGEIERPVISPPWRDSFTGRPEVVDSRFVAEWQLRIIRNSRSVVFRAWGYLNRQAGLTDKIIKRPFLAHRRELHAYLTAKLRDCEMAADLTQETFLRFAEQGGSAAILHNRAYLYRTAHNLAVDQVRRGERRRTDSVTHDDMANIPEDRPSVEDVIDARERLDRLRTAIQMLPKRTRQVFVLHRVEGLTYAEVAERLGISESSVQKHLAKALHHVMQRVKHQ